MQVSCVLWYVISLGIFGRIIILYYIVKELLNTIFGSSTVLQGSLPGCETAINGENSLCFHFF